MAEERKGFWASLTPDADELARGLIDNQTVMKIYQDGTFTTKGSFGKESYRDRLLGFDHDADSMRRKSTTGRGAAALMTGGLSLAASNNRGVVYVTVTGEQTKVRTYTTRNPSGTVLSTLRSLKAAADSVVGQGGTPEPPPAAAPAKTAVPDSSGGGDSEVAQLKQLADLYTAGVLTAEEFKAAKTRLLG